MLRCDSSDPKRRRIFEMKSHGLSDDTIVNTFVREEGSVALSSPQPLHLITWLATPLAALFGFWLYTSFLRRHSKESGPVSAADQAAMERYRGQIDSELGESPDGATGNSRSRR